MFPSRLVPKHREVVLHPAGISAVVAVVDLAVVAVAVVAVAVVVDLAVVAVDLVVVAAAVAVADFYPDFVYFFDFVAVSSVVGQETNYAWHQRRRDSDEGFAYRLQYFPATSSTENMNYQDYNSILPYPFYQPKYYSSLTHILMWQPHIDPAYKVYYPN